MEDCRFCDIISRKVEDYILWENDNILALLDLTPFNPGHCMLIPKKHIDYFFDMDDDLYSEFFTIAKKLEEPLKQATNAKRIGLSLVGFEIPHAHLHLVPLHGPNQMFDPTIFKQAKPEDLKQVQEKIVDRIKKSTINSE